MSAAPSLALVTMRQTTSDHSVGLARRVLTRCSPDSSAPLCARLRESLRATAVRPLGRRLFVWSRTLFRPMGSRRSSVRIDGFSWTRGCASGDDRRGSGLEQPDAG